MKKLTLQANQNGAGIMACKATKIPKVVPEEVARAAANSLATSSTILFAKVDGNATTEGYDGNQSSVTIDGDRYVFFDPLSKKPFNIVSEDGTNTQVNVNFSQDDIVMNADPDTYNIRNYVTTIPYTGQSLDNADQWYTINDQTGKTITFRGAFPGLKLTRLVRNPNYNSSKNYVYEDKDSGIDVLIYKDTPFRFFLERVDNTQPYYADEDYEPIVGLGSNKTYNGFIQIIYNAEDFTNGIPSSLLEEANQSIPSFGFDGFVFTFATTLIGKMSDNSYVNTSKSNGIVSAEFDGVKGLTYHEPENFAYARLGVSPESFEGINVGDSFTLSPHERKAFKIPTNEAGYYIVPIGLSVDSRIVDYIGCNCITITENMTDEYYCYPNAGAQIDNKINAINVFGNSVEGYAYLVVNNFTDSSIDMTLTDVAPSYMESSQAYKAAIYAAVSDSSNYTTCLPSELRSSYQDSFALDDAVTTFSATQVLKNGNKYTAVELTNVKSNLVLKQCANNLVVVMPTGTGTYKATKVTSNNYSKKMCVLELTEDEIANGRIFMAGSDWITASTTITQMSAEQKENYSECKAVVEAGINFDDVDLDPNYVLVYINAAIMVDKDPLTTDDNITYFDTYNDCTAAGSTCLLDSDTELTRVVNPDTVFRGEYIEEHEDGLPDDMEGPLWSGPVSVYVFLFTKNSSGNYVISKQMSASVYDDSGSWASEGKLEPQVYRYFGESVDQVTFVKRDSTEYNVRITAPAQ